MDIGDLHSEKLQSGIVQWYFLQGCWFLFDKNTCLVRLCRKCYLMLHEFMRLMGTCSVLLALISYCSKGKCPLNQAVWVLGSRLCPFGCWLVRCTAILPQRSSGSDMPFSVHWHMEGAHSLHHPLEWCSLLLLACPVAFASWQRTFGRRGMGHLEWFVPFEGNRREQSLYS